MIRRREFIAGLGGAAAWPLAAAGQQQVKRVGVLHSRAEAEPWKSQLNIFMEGMRNRGWFEGENLETKVRWGEGDPRLIQAYARDLVDCSNLTCC
jgi:putative ABC transport system substrate-binding protein